MTSRDPLQPSAAQAELKEKMRALASDTLCVDRAKFQPEDMRAIWKACGAAGLHALCMPREYGGAGHDVNTIVHAFEALGEGGADNGLTLEINGSQWAVMRPILVFGSDALKAAYLPGLINGDLIGCFAASEVDAGTDVMSMQTSATADGDHFVLNGTKSWVGVAPFADFALVLAKTDPSKGPWGISAFLVHRDDPGAEFGAPVDKHGLELGFMGDVALTDCRISADRMLGSLGVGQSLFNHTLEWERSFIFASHVGAMARQLDECTGYARQRQTMGQSIIEYQSVSNRLADMRVRLETSRLMLHRAAALKDQGKSIPQHAAMTKLHISEAFAASSLDAMRIFGAKGYMAGTNQDQDLRDAHGGVIYSGTSDIQRQIIARLL